MSRTDQLFPFQVPKLGPFEFLEASDRMINNNKMDFVQKKRSKGEGISKGLIVLQPYIR